MFLLLVTMCFALVAMDLVAAVVRPRRPRPIAPPTPDSRDFAWTVDMMAGPLDATCHVNIRPDVYEDVRDRLLSDEPPSKTYMRSDDECFEIALQEILDPGGGVGASEVAQVAQRLEQIANDHLLSNYEFAKLSLSFVHEQNIPYSYDDDSKGSEYFRFPLETIVDATGDCDCKAILACAIYKVLGFDVAFAVMPGHAALAIASAEALPFSNWSFGGRNWYYCEATGDRWEPGVTPESIWMGGVTLREVKG